MKANKFIVKGLSGTADIPQIKQSIHAHSGINAVRIDTQAGTVTVDYDEGRYTEQDIMNFVNSAGLTVTGVK